MWASFVSGELQRCATSLPWSLRLLGSTRTSTAAARSKVLEASDNGTLNLKESADVIDVTAERVATSKECGAIELFVEEPTEVVMLPSLTLRETDGALSSEVWTCDLIAVILMLFDAYNGETALRFDGTLEGKRLTDSPPNEKASGIYIVHTQGRKALFRMLSTAIFTVLLATSRTTAFKSEGQKEQV